ncbi:MAG TPA: hypothetical protein VGN07_01570 [Steroidobacteraceae bacterium]|jgi:hypothetical protein
MTRFIEDHKVNPANDRVLIRVADEPGAGGANHRYAVSWDNGGTDIDFQNGPIAEAGVNGITHEALLAIIADRLAAFQRGPYACNENAMALLKISEAQEWLYSRTRARVQRGVEGTHTV